MSLVGVSNQEELFGCSDFNLDLLKCSTDANSRDLLTLSHSLAILPVISKPTRVTSTTATVLGHIYVTVPSNITSGILVSDITDHMPTLLIRKNILYRNSGVQPKVTVQYRVTNDGALSAVYDRLSMHNFEELLGRSDVETALGEVISTINTEYDYCCSLRCKTLSVKSQKSLGLPQISC